MSGREDKGKGMVCCEKHIGRGGEREKRMREGEFITNLPSE